MRTRKGLSLLETLVVIAILTVTAGLILPAVFSTKLSAKALESKNNLRQIILATHQLADERDGHIGELTQSNLPKKPLYSEDSIFYLLVDYVHMRRVFSPNMDPELRYQTDLPIVPIYFSPGDPTLNANPVAATKRTRCSYVANMMAIDGSLQFPLAITDGTHSTIAYTEHYYFKYANSVQLSYSEIFSAWPLPEVVYGSRRATFADQGWRDVVPVTDPLTHQTRASVPGLTFQVRPSQDQLNPHIPQTPFPNGLLVAFFDGSVRTLAPATSEQVFWSLVTPAAGEVVSVD